MKYHAESVQKQILFKFAKFNVPTVTSRTMLLFKKKEQINMELFCATMKYMLIIVQPHRNQKETKGGIWEEQETLKLGLYSNYLEIPLREVVQTEPE